MTAKRVFGKGGIKRDRKPIGSTLENLSTRLRLVSHACDWSARAHGALEFSRLATVAFGALCVYDLFDERLHNGDMASETRL
jgi:hypothetical protein